MAKPRTLVFETWKGNDGQHYCHLRSGREILFPSEGYKRIAKIKRLFEILTTRTTENTRFAILPKPYEPPVKHREGKKILAVTGAMP